MANVIQGTYSVREVFHMTEQSEFKTRFENAKRDKVKVIRIKKIQYFKKDREGAPLVLYEIETQSTPQYYPYYTRKDNRGRTRKTQRKIKHEYDITFQFDRLSIDTKNWRGVVGRLGKIEDPPFEKVKTIPREKMARWKKKYSKKILERKIRNHRNRAKYLNKGDYLAQEKGLMLDFLYRCAWVYKNNGHLYERGGYKAALYLRQPPKAEFTNKKRIMFFTKHQIILLNELMNRGYLGEG